MGIQSVFARSEIKYLITPAQRELILSELGSMMRPDEFGKTCIRSIYYDTPSKLLIRRSVSGPVYKEKLRLRSYKLADESSTVYAEIKKKFKGIVYKRRVGMKLADAERYLAGDSPPPFDSQIMRELDFFLERYKTYGGLEPSAFISSDREAYYAVDDHEFRITFDDNILGRTDMLSLSAAPSGTPLLPEGRILMEVKAGGAIPLRLVKILSSERIFKSSFSKYGRLYMPEAYRNDRAELESAITT